MSDTESLLQLIRPAVESLGYELLGVEFNARAKNSLLRVYIDSENGISVSDCEQASHQISGVLDVEDPINSRYTLEVSSPGLDRPLFELSHYEKFIGNKVRIRLSRPLDNRRNFTGYLLAADDQNVSVKVDNDQFDVPFKDIQQARLVPEE